MLTETQAKRLDSIFMQRASMVPIKSFLPLQEPAELNQILRLHKLSNADYFFTQIATSQNISIPRPHGRFTFVVPSFSPGEIYCGVPRGYKTFASNIIKPIQGHTSICKGQDVYFAGELNFKNGKLESWSNNSGHYMPNAKLAQKNLIPAVKLLLPIEKFIEIF
ncbi:hypothetical protein [Pantoea agglomerans]|uniref:hypothetical protein n=1 Tax=Enterobacter agglomerans TaxID=549 RepID=UPI00241388EB|nr:hypothetical protein [Pantoea agglomerans]